MGSTDFTIEASNGVLGAYTFGLTPLDFPRTGAASGWNTFTYGTRVDVGGTTNFGAALDTENALLNSNNVYKTKITTNYEYVTMARTAAPVIPTRVFASASPATRTTTATRRRRSSKRPRWMWSSVLFRPVSPQSKKHETNPKKRREKWSAPLLARRNTQDQINHEPYK